LRQISKSAKNRIRSQTLFAWIDAVKWAKYCRTIFGVEIRDVPTAVVVHPNGEQFYDRMEDGLRFDTTEEGLLAGVEAAIEGRLKATNLNGFFSSLSNVS
jgi:hypothetical protein